MDELSAVLYALSGSVNTWRYGAICALAFLAIGCLRLFVSLWSES